MFLMKLRPEEKFAFLRLAHYIARIDDHFGDNEQEIITEYCIEMGIDDMIFEAAHFDLQETLKRFSSRESQKILIMELMILIHADDKYEEKEHLLVNEIAEHYGFDPISMQHYSQWGKAVSALYSQGKLFTNALD